MIKIMNLRSKACTWEQGLRDKYGCEDIDIPRTKGKADLRVYKRLMVKQVNDTEDDERKRGMESKPSRRRYKDFGVYRGTIGHIYDNTRGSTLLAGVQAGFLRTSDFRSRFENCQICDAPEVSLHYSNRYKTLPARIKTLHFAVSFLGATELVCFEFVSIRSCLTILTCRN